MKILSPIDFDPKTHTYWQGGSLLVSVTEVLKKAGKIDTRYFTPESAGKGKKCHRILEEYDKNELDWGKVKDDQFGYIEAWQAFLEETGIEIIEIEKRVGIEVSEIGEKLEARRYKIAGTIDRVVIFNGKVIILDIKTGQKANWYRAQLGGYHILYSPIQRVSKIWGIYLKPNGRYNKITYDINDGRSEFMEALKMIN